MKTHHFILKESGWHWIPEMPEEITLHDKADGVIGNFCVGKKITGYLNFWTGDHWSGFGRVYSREEAEVVASELNQQYLQSAIANSIPVGNQEEVGYRILLSKELTPNQIYSLECEVEVKYFAKVKGIEGEWVEVASIEQVPEDWEINKQAFITFKQEDEVDDYREYSDDIIGKPLSDYVLEMHTQEECKGFIDGWNAHKSAQSKLFTEEEVPGLSFVKWYSGMSEDKIKAAYKRFIEESSTP